MIWKQNFSLEGLNAISKNTLVDHLQIEFTEIGSDFLVARMPVDHRHVQPMRLLHGGASVTLAETVGSVASTLCLDDLSTHSVVGLEINANHLKSVREGGGFVTARTEPVRIGRRTHVWNIEIRDNKENLVCVSRLTIMVVERR